MLSLIYEVVSNNPRTFPACNEPEPRQPIPSPPRANLNSACVRHDASFQVSSSSKILLRLSMLSTKPFGKVTIKRNTGKSRVAGMTYTD